jgi:LmbE family N-acetylglucosaminyl deacetylase
MIVAHPDDEVIWGGEYLLLKKKNNESSVHVVVTSTRSKISETRREEFLTVQEHLGYHGEWLDGKDSTNDSRTLGGHVKRRIHELVCGPVQKIITHGYEGEYGHTQHQQVHDAVVDSARSCCRLDLVHVFEALPTAGHQFSSEKKQVAMMYTSQWRVLKRLAHWRERIVPLVDYDHERAIKSCREEAALLRSKSTRICRSTT